MWTPGVQQNMWDMLSPRGCSFTSDPGVQRKIWETFSSPGREGGAHRRFLQPGPGTVRCRAGRAGPSPADASPEGSFGPQGEGLRTPKAHGSLGPAGG
jgi:hypothetical protein